MNRLFSEFDQQLGLARDPFLAVGNAPDPFWDATDMRALTGPMATAQPVQGAKGQSQGQGQDKTSTALTTAGDESGALWNMPGGMGMGMLKPITADIVEREKDYLITADVPGLTRNDVSVSVDNGILTIKGERRHSYDSNLNKPAGAGAAGAGTAESKGAGAGDLKDNKAQGAAGAQGQVQGQAQAPTQNYFRRIERSYGQVSRSFKLPPNVDSNKIAAKHENGVLTVTLPKMEKKAAAQPQNINIV